MQSYALFSDQELAVLLKDGDHAAYSEIYYRYSGILYLHIYNKLRNREESKDILQELFTWLWNNYNRVEFHSSLSGYLYTSVQNRVFKYIARKQNEERYTSSIQRSIEIGYCVTDHLTRQNQLALIIEKEIDALPEKMKKVFLLSREANLSHKEIAVRLNIAEPTVKKQINNALKILRIKLGMFIYLLFLIKF